VTADRSRHTRSGARRSGDDYQDIVALEMLVDMLEHPRRYVYILVEADDFGYLDDVVGFRSDGLIVAKQVKYAVDPEGTPWTWEELLEETETEKGNVRPCHLVKWAESLENLRARHNEVVGFLETNRVLDRTIHSVLDEQGRVLLDRVVKETRLRIVAALGDDQRAATFFAGFHIEADRPSLANLTERVRRRFSRVGGTEQGWLNLKDELRGWVRLRTEPSPDGSIRIEHVRAAALWHELSRLPEEFEVPTDYVLPSEEFHSQFVDRVIKGAEECVVVTGSPGIGKSTYLSHLFGELREQGVPVVRHHYFLSLRDRTPGRLSFERAAESLMADILEQYPDAPGDYADRNPDVAELSQWLDACAQHFAGKGQALLLIIDGLDHVWRESNEVRELNRLFDHLLPAPQGMRILVGTQPVDDARLPFKLVQSVPRETWANLPTLSQTGVEEWLDHHEAELETVTRAHSPGEELERLAHSFYVKSGGHPLHLRYSLQTLLEQGRPVTPEEVEALPACAHAEIEQYYHSLWQELPELARHILHLLAACAWPWRKTDIFTCLDPLQQRLDELNKAFEKAAHLLRRHEIGYEPYHSSLPSFIETHEGHEDLAPELKQKAYRWLHDLAPEYWRWSYEWVLAAELGDPEPLIAGPSRDWAVEGFARRFPFQVFRDIMLRSLTYALKKEDLPRAVEVGLLRDYVDFLCDYRSETYDDLLPAQLLLEEDELLRARLLSGLHNLSARAIEHMATNAYVRDDKIVVDECLEHVRRRRIGQAPRGAAVGASGWSTGVTEVLAVAALSDQVDLRKITGFLNALEDKDLSCRFARALSGKMRARARFDSLRSLLSAGLEEPMLAEVLRQSALAALEQEVEFDRELESVDASGIYVALYRHFRGVPLGGDATPEYPDAAMLAAPHYEYFDKRDRLQSFFHRAFFSLLLGQLLGAADKNRIWLEEVGTHTWRRRLLHRFNELAGRWDSHFKQTGPPAFSWLYFELDDFCHPEFPKERDEYEFWICARDAVTEIGLDLLALSRAVGVTPEIDRDELEKVFQSEWCVPILWIPRYVERSRLWVTDEAARWVVQEWRKVIDSDVAMLPERASAYAELSRLAAMHNLRDDAKRLVRDCTSNLLSYGDHKDLLLWDTLSCIRKCAESGAEIAPEWVRRIAPAVGQVMDFTDGDETSGLPSQLADVLSVVSPEKIPAYYEWLADREDYQDALSAFQAHLRTCGLESPCSVALASTAIDRGSIGILDEMARNGNERAAKALAQITGLFAIPSHEEAVESQESIPLSGVQEQLEPNPEEYPPDRFDEFFEQIRRSKPFDFKSHIGGWLRCWQEKGQGREAFDCVKGLVEAGWDTGTYDLMAELAARFHGKDSAYDWLLRSYVDRWGWSRYSTSLEDSQSVWAIVRDDYRTRWLDFVRDTICPVSRIKWGGTAMHGKVLRLVEYCLFMGQGEMATGVTDKIVDAVEQLVSPLPLRRPSWVAE